MVNSQGLTALDIVNMYTDPRSAGQMKQVLQGECWVEGWSKGGEEKRGMRVGEGGDWCGEGQG